MKNKKMKTIAQQLNVKEFPFDMYDSNGNHIYHENSDGYWYKWERDSNGNPIYYKNSKGEWRKYEYDSVGNLIYYENSKGEWRKYEYDSVGNLIKEEKNYRCDETHFYIFNGNIWIKENQKFSKISEEHIKGLKIKDLIKALSIDFL